MIHIPCRPGLTQAGKLGVRTVFRRAGPSPGAIVHGLFPSNGARVVIGLRDVAEMVAGIRRESSGATTDRRLPSARYDGRRAGNVAADGLGRSAPTVGDRPRPDGWLGEWMAGANETE